MFDGLSLARTLETDDSTGQAVKQRIAPIYFSSWEGHELRFFLFRFCDVLIFIFKQLEICRAQNSGLTL